MNLSEHLFFFCIISLCACLYDHMKHLISGARDEEVDFLRDKVRFWASLWALVSSVFRDYSFHAISYY